MGTLQLSSNEQEPMLKNITGITSAECDLIIIAHDGRKIYSHTKLVFLFSKTVSTWISSLTSCTNDLISLTVDASFQCVNNMLSMLCSGKANITHEEEMLKIIELAKQLGIDMENSETDFSKPVDVLRSDSSEKKRRRRNRKQVINLDEFCFFNEEDPLVSLQNSTAIDSLTVEKSTDIKESENEPHVQEVELDSNENTPGEFEMSVKIE